MKVYYLHDQFSETIFFLRHPSHVGFPSQFCNSFDTNFNQCLVPVVLILIVEGRPLFQVRCQRLQLVTHNP